MNLHECVMRAMGDLGRPVDHLALYPENTSRNLTDAHEVGGLVAVMTSAGLVIQAAAIFLDANLTAEQRIIEVGKMRVTLIRSEVPGKYFGRVDFQGPYGHSTLARLTLGLTSNYANLNPNSQAIPAG